MLDAEARFAGSGDRRDAQEVLQAFRTPTLIRVWDHIVDLARPSARLVRSSSPTGMSRLGGLPLVETDFQWPRGPNGNPLLYVGQVDLTDVNRTCRQEFLPRSGVLSFYYDAERQASGYRPSDRGQWAVVYALQPKTTAAIPEGVRALPEMSLAGVGDLTLPQSDSTEIEAIALDAVEADAYESILDQLKTVHGTGNGRTIHRVLGWPDAIQHDPAILAELATNGVDGGDPAIYDLESTRSLLSKRDEWQLLAQIDSDDSIGLMWGIYGRVYFMMRRADLRNGSWSAAWAPMQWS